MDDGDDDDEDEEAGAAADEERELDAQEAVGRARDRGTRSQRRLAGSAAASVSIPSSPSTTSSSSSAAAAAAADASEAAARKVTRALNSAAGSLSRRPHSRAELERKLSDRGHSREAATLALDRLRGMGLLPGDREFARAFARARFRTAAWAPSRIRAELVRRRGVSPEDASAALRDVFGSDSSVYLVGADDEAEEEADDEAGEPGRARGERSDGNGEEDVEEDEERDGSGNGGEDGACPSVFEASWDPISAKDQSARLLEAAERQAHLSRGLPLAARRRRLAGWLARRGHGWKTASAVMERVGL